MKRFDWKQLCIYAAAVLSAKAGVAGAYPFIPAVFMVGFMSGVNRSLLFFCSLAGLLLFVPVVSLIKYSLALILAMILVKGLEWYRKNCSCMQSALIARRKHSLYDSFWIWTASAYQREYTYQYIRRCIYNRIRTCSWEIWISVYGMGAAA